MTRGTVRVPLGQAKAGEGAEKSFLKQRKTRRGLRGGKSLSAVGYAARAPSAHAEKGASSRVVNHKGRKYLWAMKAANRLASLKPTQRLLEAFPENETELRRWKRAVHAENRRRLALNPNRVPLLTQYLRRWHVLASHARKCDIPPICAFEEGPWKFLKMRTPCWGAADLLDLAAHLAPDATSSSDFEPRYGRYFDLADRQLRHTSALLLGRIPGRFCRLCGEYGHFGSECNALLPRRGGRSRGRRPSRGRGS